MKLIYNNNKVSIYNETNNTVFYEYNLSNRFDDIIIDLESLKISDKAYNYSKKCFYIKELNTVYDNNFNTIKTNVKEFHNYGKYVVIDNCIYSIELKLCKRFYETVSDIKSLYVDKMIYFVLVIYQICLL